MLDTFPKSNFPKVFSQMATSQVCPYSLSEACGSSERRCRSGNCAFKKFFPFFLSWYVDSLELGPARPMQAASSIKIKPSLILQLHSKHTWCKISNQKKLKSCLFSNPHIFAAFCRRPSIFWTISFSRLQRYRNWKVIVCS